MLAIMHAKLESVICFPDSDLIPAKTDPEQEYKVKPNLFSVSFEVEREQATPRKDKSISVTPDHLSSALQTFKKNGGNVLNEQKNSDGKRYYLDHQTHAYRVVLFHIF